MLIQRRFEGKCIRVIDGDTIICEMRCPHCGIVQERRVRLARIDAPELDGPLAADAEYVRQRLDEMITGKSVAVQLAQTWPDKYGRVLAEVFCGGVNVSTLLLDAGLVALYRKR